MGDDGRWGGGLERGRRLRGVWAWKLPPFEGTRREASGESRPSSAQDERTAHSALCEGVARLVAAAGRATSHLLSNALSEPPPSARSRMSDEI